MRSFVCKMAGETFVEVEAEDMDGAAVATVVALGLDPLPRANGRLFVFVHEKGGEPSMGGRWVDMVYGEWRASR